jgi:hypothetical protein
MTVASGIEVDARNVANVIQAFRLVPQIAYQILTKYRLGQISPDGTFVPDPRPWWPLSSYLAALTNINEVVGTSKMLEIGKLVHRHASLPPSLHDIYSAFDAIDAAYHLNHRKDGAVMFDLASGRALEGIGHYRPKADPNGKRITVVCETPYPCDVDRGILWGFALRFEARAFVEHATASPCRKNGAASCTFAVTW